ncbi:MAG: enoyl-CoA hydratase-related protein, partial [Gammaproteobacteria bacterium]|nr:enoyl-CoA hydratase-related protein [Gammaproteobacteria bacterium]
MELKTEKMLASVDNGIGWITFNNPARRNAISLEMWEGMGVILEAFQNDASVRVVVMRGAGGKAFVSGADISEFDKNRSNAEQKVAYGRVAANANRWLSKLDKPLIAMIQGYCIGGGLATALGADIRFATPGSVFGIPAAKLGLG